MSLLLALLLLNFPATPSAVGDSTDVAFQEGNQAYAAGRYGRAVEAYRAVLESGRASAELYYNLGNAYYRSGEVGRAIQYYEKARRLRPGDPRIRHNLEQARERVPGSGTLASAPPWVRLVAGWPPLPILGAAVALLAAAGALAVAWAGSDDPAPGALERAPSVWSHPVVAGLVVTGLLVAAAAMGVSYVQHVDRRAVVVADRVPVRSAPQASAAADTVLSEGLLVRLPPPSAATGADTTWTPVRLSPSRTGWVPTRALGRVD